MKKALGPALIGAVVAAGIQPFTPAGWWLDSGRGVVITALALALPAVVVGFLALEWPVQPTDAAPAAALWAGANVGMAIVLFSVGPGNLFPIVLAIGAVISAIAVAAGSICGAGLSRVIRRAPD